MIKGFGRSKGLYNLDRARSTRGEWGVEEPTPVHGHLVQKLLQDGAPLVHRSREIALSLA